MDNKYIATAKDWAQYIMFKHDGDISPIKLQKTLYFCYAFWAGFVNKQNLGNVEFKFDQPTYLFREEFEAWTYGPVIRSVYNDFKLGNLVATDFSDSMKENKLLFETVDDIIADAFEMSDFKLVALSHEDSCWIKHFHDDANDHDKIIPRDEIRDEYTGKSFA